MKIFSIISSLYGGGAEKLVADLSLHTDKLFQNTIVLSKNSKKKYPHSAAIKYLKAKGSNFILKNYGYFKTLNQLKNNNPDGLYISHLWVSNILNTITKTSGLKTIIFMHGRWSITPEKGWLLDNLTSYFYNKASAVVCVSKYMLELYKDYHGNHKNLYVIYNGVDLPNIQNQAEANLDLNLPEKFLVYVAGFRHVKNHIGLLENLKNFLLETDYHLVFIGDGELKEAILNEIKFLSLENKVTLLGNLPNPHAIVKKAKYALLASKDESFSLTVVEAQALGIPVISTDCGGPREILASAYLNQDIAYPFYGIGGILIKKDLTINIGEIIKSITTDQYSQLSNEAKTNAEKFSIQKTVEQYIQLVKTIG